ncbi:MAG: CopD family protein, partial [Anaerolineae bacterium]|nr:CopD family protein [Anaerolineae bacterium]
TVIWIGGLLITTILVWPEMRRVLENTPSLYSLLTRLRKRFYPISNISLAVLIVTGLFQMTADPNYDGVMTFDNEWSKVMLAKHITIILMALSGWLLQYGVVPSLERTTMLLERSKGDIGEWSKLRQREVRLTWLNVTLGLCVLGFSAWATAI